jgi:3-oxoacyl-[acyl-carrier-protein] synthase-3
MRSATKNIHGSIAAIEYYLPMETLTTKDLMRMFPDWAADKVDARTGIQCRHIASREECASDLAVGAVRNLFRSGLCYAEEVDFVLLCTQSPDYLLPSTSCLLQDRLGIPTRVGALDFNLGCSGFVYGLGLAEGLIVSGQARVVLLITADTYSKYINETDKVSRMIFGDGAAATLIRARESSTACMGPFLYGTSGKGANDLILLNSAVRRGCPDSKGKFERGLKAEEKRFLYMNGSRMFEFALATVPQSVRALLDKAGMPLGDVDLFIFHQANACILEELRKMLRINKEKFQLSMRDSGNTISSTIPIALKQAQVDGRLWDGACILLVGFGVGYSWGATLIRWTQS